MSNDYRRERILRRRLNRRARTMRRSDPARTKILQILDDAEMWEVFAGDVLHRHNCDCDDQRDHEFGAGLYGGPFQDFLTWLIENFDEILKIVSTIIDLFTSNETLAQSIRAADEYSEVDLSGILNQPVTA